MNSFSSGESAQRAYLELEQTLQTNPQEESISRLEDFLRQYPDFAQAHNDLGVLFYNAGNKLQTLGHYEKAVRLNPLNSTFRKNLASFYYVEMGWVDDAIFLYTDILAKHPNDTEVLAALGLISVNLDRSTEARIFFTRILELEPWNQEVRSFLADLDSQPGPATETVKHAPASVNSQDAADLDAILSDLRETIAKLENQSPAEDRYANALTLLKQGDQQGTIRELERLIQCQPNHAVAHNDLGVLYQMDGVIDKSLQHHELAVKADPDNATFKRNLAGLYFAELGRTDDAICLLTEILRSHPDDIETLTGLGQIALAIGQREEATTFIQKVTELEPWNTDARELLGQIQEDSSFFLTSR